MKVSGFIVAIALVFTASMPTVALAWSCSSEGPLAAPLSPEERARVAAEVERERRAAIERSKSTDTPLVTDAKASTAQVVGARKTGNVWE
jgi:hypothetical protein